MIVCVLVVVHWKATVSGGYKLKHVLDHGYVDLVTHWGSDEEIIRAARMSTSKGFQGWDKDEKLLKYLWTNKHLSPFEMCGASFEVQCPIFVAREWMRHRTQSFNEMSGRYTELPKLCYIPSIERLEFGGQAQQNKQSSGAPLSTQNILNAQEFIRETYYDAYNRYERMLKDGVSREIARMILPVNQYTKFRTQSNLRNWLHFLDLRLPENAQWEIRQYAQQIKDYLKFLYPKTMELHELV